LEKSKEKQVNAIFSPSQGIKVFIYS
jgi:hypothetical protein